MRACWLKWVGRDWSISADYIWLNYSGANTAWSLPAALRIRCTMQRCRAAPGKTSWMARLSPSWASLVTQMTPS